ncbi:hypothetical protein JCM9140_334 [Halalkalibacter wakoensis JCM 9140]|uniref:Uncharacterized protein n=1 Tax=Halalkalibacter wakoensis JCM 9140 TaxID=1236970 RepID=W4PY87_9BACI|nr:hypothetical protein [Halalkalibacter wakoensis]GAE24413.1 hypothetical protein JCM9140_334 [Halalkalibacter wakoensis JCM 9140]
MKKIEILEKIELLTTKSDRYEVFVLPRPPEEFGDGVKLYFDKADKTYTAEVFDPDTKEVFTEKTFTDIHSTYTFITNVLEPKVDKQNKQSDYIDLDIGESTLSNDHDC